MTKMPLFKIIGRLPRYDPVALRISSGTI
jgi:hypothetical protein